MNRIPLVIGLVIFGLTLDACSTPRLPTAVEVGERPSTATLHPRRLENLGTPGNVNVTVFDEYGLGLTFDESSGILSLSTGEWLTLDNDMVMDLVSEFEAIREIDAMIGPLQTSVNDWNPYANCGQGGPCEDIRQPELEKRAQFLESCITPLSCGFPSSGGVAGGRLYRSVLVRPSQRARPKQPKGNRVVQSIVALPDAGLPRPAKFLW